MLVDSHCHLDYPGLAEDEAGVVARARAAGVTVMQTIGTRLSAFQQTLAVAERHEGVWCSVGVHPHEAGREGIDEPGPLLRWTGHPKVIGIGESGLDYFYDHAPRDRQAASFRAHIAASRQSGLPLVIHTRDADDDMATMLEQEMARGPFAGVVHCYSSGRQLGERATALGLHLGIGGILTFRRSDELRAIVADMPRQLLLLETDSPYLAPVPKRGRTNEPAYTAFVARVLADVLGTDVEDVAALTTGNFFRLFRKAAPVGAVAA
ncbi:MAG TPA: TatD family hydrolase [Geminicoccaceae bacterium]|nr:TatD family hydrolase [Geminicoccus sp.]HMU49071.1 TatD family hydrolase [Geminicoccaceae bacterium]